MLIDTPTLGLILYYSQWVFLAVMLIGCIVAFCLKPSQHDGGTEEDVDDEEQQGLLSSNTQRQQPHQYTH